MSLYAKEQKTLARRVTLRDESLAENKELGLEAMQEQMDLLFAVLHEHGINSRLWMQEYLEAAERNGGTAPVDFKKFLPWNLTAEAKARMSKDSVFSYAKANFIQNSHGTVLHLRKDGTREKIDIGSLTGDQFDKLTGLKTSG